MKNINMNKKMRELLFSIGETFKQQNDGKSILDEDVIIEGMASIPSNEISKRLLDVYHGVINATGYSDMMTALILEKKIVGLNKVDYDFLTILRKVDSYDELVNLYYAIPEIYSYAMKDMIRFYDSIAYHKILRFKCLSDEDIAQISKINPIFYQDLDEYNIDVNLEYIMQKIKSMSKKGKNKDDLLNDAAAFITNISKIDNETAIKIKIQMIEKCIRLIDYYQKNCGGINESMSKLLNLFSYNINFCINNFNFDLIKLLLDISLIYVDNEDMINEVLISKENQQLIDNIKKYELEIKNNV